MAVTGYPFETQDTTETQYAKIVREAQDDGVMASHGAGDLAPSIPGGNMRVNLANGILWGAGRIIEVTGGTEYVLLPVDGAIRQYWIVGRWDMTANTVALGYVQGAAGGAAPALTQTDILYEVLIATVTVTAGATSLTAGMLTDRRQFAGNRFGVWSTATRPVAPRKGRLGLNLTTGLVEYATGLASPNDWANLGAAIRYQDVKMPATRADMPNGVPAYNLLDGKRISFSDDPPVAGFGQDWDIVLEY